MINPRLLQQLSKDAQDALAIDPDSAYARLVPDAQGRPAARPLLSKLSPRDVMSRPTQSPADAACVFAGLWLWHDYLDESHRIAQDVHTPSGSYWHAIVHRREGDFWNSKYWLNRAGDNPATAAISAAAAPIVNAQRHADRRLVELTLGDWDAGRFVDLVEEFHARPEDPMHAMLVRLQRVEWEGLMNHCITYAAA